MISFTDLPIGILFHIFSDLLKNDRKGFVNLALTCNLFANIASDESFKKSILESDSHTDTGYERETYYYYMGCEVPVVRICKFNGRYGGEVESCTLYISKNGSFMSSRTVYRNGEISRKLCN